MCVQHDCYQCLFLAKFKALIASFVDRFEYITDKTRRVTNVMSGAFMADIMRQPALVYRIILCH